VFGTPGRFDEVYPDVEVIRVRAWQDPSHVRDEYMRDNTCWFGPDGGHMTPKFPCGNPLCKHGGIDWRMEFEDMRRDRETERTDVRVPCRGTEGHGKRCLNYAKVSIEVAYKAT